MRSIPSSRFVFCFIAAALAPGCKTRSTEPGSPPGAQASVPPGTPSFQRDILPVFQTSCASARGCHGANPNDWIDLDLRPEKAWSQLVGFGANERDNAFRVKPFEPDQSFLVDKLTGRLGRREGKQMPLDPATNRPQIPSSLPPDFLEKTLKPWIAAGAPNN